MRNLPITAMAVTAALQLFAQDAPLPRTEVAAGTILQIRLQQTVSSMISKAGKPVSAMVIQPVEVNGRTLLPAKSILRGQIRHVRRVGLGFSHETAMIDMDFDTLVVPDGASLPIHGRFSLVNDSREVVDETGRIHGIRATASMSNVISGIGISVASVDPVMLAFSLSTSLSVFRIPESEILLPAGAELSFRLTDAVDTHGSSSAPPRSRLQTAAERETWTARLQTQPYRTATASGDTPSDIVSIAYVASPAALTRAFDAAGWAQVDRRDAKSSYHAMRSIVENQGYRSAPMSMLLLDHQTPAFEFSKTLDTFFKRHHMRMYALDIPELSEKAWVSTATHDSGIAFSKASKTFVHLIDHDIDAERTKVVDDMLLTGCVESVDYLERPWIPSPLINATGDNMVTDGRIAVLFLNACEKPERADAESDPPKRLKEPVELRPVRDMLLRFKNDAFRGNLGYQSVAGARMLHRVLRKQADPTETHVIHMGGEEFEVVAGVHKAGTKEVFRDPGARLPRKERSYATLLDLSINSGYSRFANETFSTQNFVGSAADPVKVSVPVSLEQGWSLAPRITLNFARRFSSEFSFASNQTSLRIMGIPSHDEAPQIMTARVRQFSYNLIIHLRRNGARFRPYAAVGPAFQLIRAVDAKPTTNRLLHFALADLSLIRGAYEFGSKPPLEGGGIFQFGLQYGGGFKYQLTPRYFWRMDFRETLSPQPDFWSDSRSKLNANTELPLKAVELSSHGPLRHNLVTMGFGISF